jgi:hypothetical protein
MSQKKKPSSVRHTRAIRVAETKHVPAIAPDPLITERLTELVHPATYAQMDFYHRLGLRDRLLNLPVMVALVISMIWRHIGSASELVRVLAQEGFLWVSPLQVTQQALSLRLQDFPAILFERVLLDVLPPLQARWEERQRPLPSEVAWARERFGRLLIFDGSTLDSLLRKLKALREWPQTPLAGRMGALLDLGSRLPVQIWYEPDAQAHDHRFVEPLLTRLKDHDLLVFDGGFLDFDFFDHLTEGLVTFITRPHTNTVFQGIQVLQRSATIHDQIIHLGSSPKSSCVHRMRRVEVLYQGSWYRYLTNALDPQRLPAEMIVALYRRRWRIERAFLVVKRLLGLAYVWVGSENGIQLQIWATWLLYGLLVDLTDAVATELNVLFDAISVEMVFRGLYHFTQAYHRGDAHDPILYLAAHAHDLAILKRKRSLKATAAITNGP